MRASFMTVMTSVALLALGDVAFDQLADTIGRPASGLNVRNRPRLNGQAIATTTGHLLLGTLAGRTKRAPNVPLRCDELFVDCQTFADAR